MKEDFVSYSQAQTLKQLGFDWECDYWFYNENQRLIHVGKSECFDFYNMTEAPSIALAQKWLREVKKYEVNAFWDFETSKWEAYCYDMTLPPLRGTDTLNSMFDTYELALSAGIDAALKILE